MRNRFQYQIATGRLTLPIAIMLSVILWVITLDDRMEVIPFLTGSIVTYLLIELNTLFALTRSRSSLPSAIFIILYSAAVFLHEYGKGECWMLLLFMGSLYCLLKGYESKNVSSYVFHSFLWLGIGSLIEPDVIFNVPLLLIVMPQLRLLNIKTLFAGIIGLCTPYWLITGYNLYKGDNIMVLTWFNHLMEWHITDYANIPLQYLVTTACIFIISAVSGITSIITSLNDKVKNRIIIGVMNTIGIYETLLVVIKPMMLKSVLPIIITMCAILFGYTMIQRSGKFTYIFMIVSLVITSIMAIYNVMLHFGLNILI